MENVLYESEAKDWWGEMDSIMDDAQRKVTIEDLSPQIQAKLLTLKAGTAASTETGVSSLGTGGALQADVQQDAVRAGGRESAATGRDVSKRGTAAPRVVPADADDEPPGKRRRQEGRREPTKVATLKGGKLEGAVPPVRRRGGASRSGKLLD